MKKIYFLLLGLFSLIINAQTYCTPAFDLGCNGGDSIGSFTIPAAGFSDLNTGCSTGSYEDFYSTKTITLQAGVVYNYNVTHLYYDEHVRIWADFNNDGTFIDATPELISVAFSGTGINNISTNGTINVPSTITPGTYRLRIAVKYNDEPLPCNTLGFGEAHDYKLIVNAAPSCLSPSNTIVNSITTNSASISWSAPATIPANGYEYYYSTSSTSPTSTTIPSGSASTNTATLSGLNQATTYYVWVRSVCSSSDKSNWTTNFASFTTGCSVVTPSYTNDFSNYPGICWTIASNGSESTGPTGDASGIYFNWRAASFLQGQGTGAAALNLYDINRIGWLISPIFNLTGGGYTLTFNYGVTDYNSSNPAVMGSDDAVKVLMSVNGGTTWTVIKTWTAADNVTNTNNTFTYPISSTSNQVIFAILGSDGTTNDPQDYDFNIDNFAITSTPLSTIESGSYTNEITIYPNPFVDILMISDIKNVQSISVIDFSGRLVKKLKPTKELQLGDLKTGLYFINLYYKDGTFKAIKAIKK